MLFRSEVLAQRHHRLSGDVTIAVPITWQSIVILISVGVVAAVVLLSWASYSRVETVVGAIVPEAGISSVVPSRAGTVTAVSIADGQMVRAGDNLAVVRAEEDGASLQSPAALVEAAIARQDDSIAAQIVAANAAAGAQTQQLGAQRNGLAAEIAQLRSQIETQQALIASAGEDLDLARKVAESGFISRRDLQVREETLLARRQGLAQLEQSLAAKKASLAATERSAVQVVAQSRAEAANLSAMRAQVAQQAVTTAGARAYVLRAPIAGRVTALTARVGQPARPQEQLMAIVPASTPLRAELAVPSSAIGFLKAGQSVKLAIDSFPYQRFGTIAGRVQTVASSPVNTQGENGAAIPIYLVTVAIQQPSIKAYGRDERLVPGMTLTARIVTEKRTLVQWLLDPLYAVQRR